MKVKVETWKIADFLRLKDQINEQPAYQRGEVWTLLKKKHLIDSILRGIDIPKIYLRKVNQGAFQYEVADGQQRLTSIIKYLENGFRLDDKNVNGLNLSLVNNYTIGGKNFSNLHPDLQTHFNNYELTIAIVENATNDEIRTLFGRLQLGSSLNPAEKRNAIISIVGNEINNFALNHQFFSASKIPNSRYRKQDYLAHVIALIKYNNENALKADLLLKLYLDNSLLLNAQDQNNIDCVLDHLYELDQKLESVKLVNKFTFIDFYLFFYEKLDSFAEVDYIGMAEAFVVFDGDRLFYHKDGPDQLISKTDPSTYDKVLYSYIDAFHNAGYEPSKISTRATIFVSLFSKFLR